MDFVAFPVFKVMMTSAVLASKCGCTYAHWGGSIAPLPGPHSRVASVRLAVKASRWYDAELDGISKSINCAMCLPNVWHCTWFVL